MSYAVEAQTQPQAEVQDLALQRKLLCFSLDLASRSESKVPGAEKKSFYAYLKLATNVLRDDEELNGALLSKALDVLSSHV